VTQPLVRSGARRRGDGAKVIVAAGLALVAGLFGGVGGAWLMLRSDGAAGTAAGVPVSVPRVTTTVAPSVPVVVRPADSVAGIASQVLPSVVEIKVSDAQGEEGTGSGFVIDDQGHILTNHHVASAFAQATLTVVLDDGTQQRATVVGSDASYDLAVLKTEVGERRPLVFGDSDAVAVGDPVIAIGAPLGLQGTVTTGIVSAKNRPVSAGDGSGSDTSYMNAIQTDAAINPGNSGGPLVDVEGHVIGVNSAIARAPGSGLSSGTSGNIGLGFAIPSNQAHRIAEMLISKGVVEHPIIGVQLDRRYDGEGVKVIDAGQAGGEPVTPGGPADVAGVKPGDVIVAIDGRPVTSSVELIVAIRAKAVGDTTQLTVLRDGRRFTLTVTLAAAES